MKLLIFGVTGMLGNVLFRYFSEQQPDQVWGTLRRSSDRSYFSASSHEHLIEFVDVQNSMAVSTVLQRLKPDWVINCVGIIKQLPSSHDSLVVIPINALWPHQLAHQCQEVGAKLIHFSTDCVFSGKKGHYSEQNESDATDLYGRSKFLGEVIDKPDVLTIRSSIIGHELFTHYALVDWFLSQQGPVKGYTKAIYTGLPTIEMAQLIEGILHNPYPLHGLYQVAAQPISKYDLLHLIGQVYNHQIIIEPDDSVAIDRSLNGALFEQATGYHAPPWPTLIQNMHDFNQKWRTHVS